MSDRISAYGTQRLRAYRYLLLVYLGWCCTHNVYNLGIHADVTQCKQSSHTIWQVLQHCLKEWHTCVLKTVPPFNRFPRQTKKGPFYHGEALITTLHYTKKKVELKWLHPWSCFMVHNSAPPVALFWHYFHRWSFFCLKNVQKWYHLPRWSNFWLLLLTVHVCIFNPDFIYLVVIH